MKPILKWPGGKEKELEIIRKKIPTYSGRYVEPFVGGGAVFFDTSNPSCYINDKSSDLINFYNCIKDKDKDFVRCIQQEYEEFLLISSIIEDNKSLVLDVYNQNIPIDTFVRIFLEEFKLFTSDYSRIFVKELKSNLSRKIKRSAKLEKENGAISSKDKMANIEAAVKSAYYMYIRYLLNNMTSFSKGRQAAIFWFIREYCYSSMFRYNKNGDFNVPYGGISYNKKDFGKKIRYALSTEVFDKLRNTSIQNKDFEKFIDELRLNKNDFIFLDPPYDSDFSTYDKNKFGKSEQKRLFNCLKHTSARFMLIIKNTEFIYEMYHDTFHIESFTKNYLVSFMNRNEKKVKHLIITNY
ncbi:DNA adenine methylase [Lactobacillus sp. ESL0684]|uniref:DNA adenine methylase n=1 Tax=Lactobacillus sp. ESL0684 TaxID=2983213 RepID=UPI0023F98C89|nr:DNA adenine methylase [Lactobacillus sp. ESL0684]WEV43778.1 DNA adenine methylase [Lactobacillus sp. ESL0684]